MARRDDTECGNCDYYDPYPCADECLKYHTPPQRITRCEHKTVKGQRIHDASNPLRMKRELQYCEVWHQGRVRTTQHDLYNPDGISHHEADNRDDEGNITKR